MSLQFVCHVTIVTTMWLKQVTNRYEYSSSHDKDLCKGTMPICWGVYIRWNGMVEWNSGMDYWNGGMLRGTYLIIQHELYSEQYLITGNIRACHGCRQKYSKPVRAEQPHLGECVASPN